MEIERRAVTESVTVRADTEQAATVSGYAALFNTETVIAGLFREQIAPGAFASAVTDDDVRALFNHDSNIVLGRTKSGTLTLREDSKGLYYDVVLPKTQAANDVRELIQRGDVSGSSFGFRVVEEKWQEPKTRADMAVRTILKAELFDVSPVTYPAYPTTSVSARSQAEALAGAQRDLDSAYLDARAAGVTAREATRVALEQAKAWRR